MRPVSEQLTNAYRQQEAYYTRIRELVREQMRVMEAGQDPGKVLGLCRQIEELMERIATIERALEPAKRHWEATAGGTDEGLDRVLRSIEEAIEEIARNQQRVQERLLAYVDSQKQKTEGARTTIRLGRARSAYRAG